MARQTRQKNTIIVDDDGAGEYTTIQAAIDNASVGDLILVWDGIYEENITINKTIEVRGNHSSTTILTSVGTNNSVVNIAADNVTVSGFTIQNGEYTGIELIGCKKALLINNCITNNTYGIWIFLGRAHTLSQNTIQLNEKQGVYINLGVQNQATTNNFIQNNEDHQATHAFFWNAFLTTGDQNYWDNHQGSNPKQIPGEFNPFFSLFDFPIPWTNFDWHPAETPNSIP